MARKKTTKKTSKPSKTTRVSRVVAQPKKSAFANFIDYLRLGESYTSLVLGIVAVIIATILLLSVIHTRQAKNLTPEVTPTIAQSNSFAISGTSVPVKPGMQSGSQIAAPGLVGKTYTVVAGDNLWIIAEKVYGSGYNWVDIAKANKLSDPNDIHLGNKLVIPQVAAKVATVHTADDHLSTAERTKITADSYVVKPGDDLWDIAVRAYGDGYQWTKIAKANNLSNPNLIHVGNTIKIPRI
jgi:nucleoid-associated protein YgaU